MGGASKLLMLLSIPFPLLHPRPVAFRLARHSKLAALTSLRTISNLNSPHRLSSPLTHFHAQAAVRDDGGGGYTLESPTLGGGGAGAGDSRDPWPEWMRLVDHITAGGYLDRRVSVGAGGGDDSFSGFERLPEEFVRAADACLLFARERPELLRLLSKKDVEVVVENGPPFLFKNALNSSRRMRAFLGGEDSSVMNDEKAETVDVMRYLLGYVYNRLVSSGENYTNAMELVEASVRNLFSELVGISGTFQSPKFTESTPRQEPSSYEQPPRYRESIEMKRGDWICPKCQFMNFAKNMKCLECDEGRPKRQLTGGEWECPQCDFFNYGRNTTCLRCDCKRPEGTQSSTASPASDFGYDRNSNFGEVYNGSNTNKTEIERRLAENDEKAERWFSKVSQLGDTSDLSNAIADKDFPEIMPLRKGVNRFVVSTRKTPLERKLANDQYRRNMVSDGSAEGNGSGTTTGSTISSTLDRILGQSSVALRKNDSASPSAAREINAGTGSSSPQRRDPGSVPFVPLPADMFRKPLIQGQQSSENVSSTGFQANPWNESEPGRSEIGKPINTSLSDMPGNLTGSKMEEMVSANSDGDFPDIMPIRKGENRFVISKKKDRSLTSPQYKRRLAMEQANSSNFVPFVPFPPGYFAKTDTQSEAGDITTKAESASTTSLSENIQNIPENFSDRKSSPLKSESLNVDSHHECQQTVGDSRSSESFGREWNRDNVNLVDGRGTNSMSWTNKTWNNKGEARRNRFVQQDGSGRLNHAGISNPSSWNNNNTSRSDGPSMNSARSSPPLSQINNDRSWRYGSNRGEDSHGTCANERSVQPSRNNNRDNQGSQSFSGSKSNSLISAEKTTQQAGTSQNARQGWNGGFTGKSLEGSAVTEPDPLDMSEEAKAQRWFRRVAQITDISELSKIPDEDFPEIMPMRKGVNRFVVSKRKTPLERRLTSPQYRRNLPIVSSEPEKDSKQGNA